MKIMFVISTMSNGGSERVIANLANYLIKNNDVAIVTIKKMTSQYYLNDKIQLFSLDDYNTKMNSLYKANRLFHRVKKLNTYKKTFNADIVVSFLSISCYLTLISNFFYKVRTIVSIRNDPKIEFLTVTKKILMKALYPKADGIVFQTEDARDFFSEKIRKKGYIIPNPINPDFIIEKCSTIRNPKIVNVGRLDYQKNQKLLIDAFSKIHNEYPEYKLYIYGEGNLRFELEKQIDELGLKDSVFLPGIKTNIKDEIKDAKVFILSSLFEGMPNALMEAMALGIPSISTDCPCGGPKFLIKNGVNGILVKNDNIEEMVAAIKKIIKDDNYANNLSKEAHKICETLNPTRINIIWERYIMDIKEGKK